MANEKENKSFSFETVATIVAALQSQGKALGNKEYELMAELDGTRSASSFEHSFRSVKKRAQEISKKGATKNAGKASADKATPRKRTKAGSNGGILHASKSGAKESGKHSLVSTVDTTRFVLLTEAQANARVKAMAVRTLPTASLPRRRLNMRKSLRAIHISQMLLGTWPRSDAGKRR